MINDAQLNHARQLMVEFEAGVGTSDGLEKVSKQIYAAVGVQRSEQVLEIFAKNQSPAWHWITDIAEAAAAQKDITLVSRVFTFMAFWHLTVAPRLGPGDFMDLLLPAPPADVQARITAAALPCLAQLPPDHVVTGNSTGQFTAGHMAKYAAQAVVTPPEPHPVLTADLVDLARKVLDPAPEPQSLLAPAARQLERVKAMLTEHELRFTDLGEAVVGVGVALCWGETDWVVVSINGGGNENAIAVTAGILKNCSQDRPLLLDTCNSMTRDNTVYPVYLHDAADGWDVLVQQRFHIDLVLTNPVFFRNTLVNLPTYARQKREELVTAGIQGDTHLWDGETIHRLFIRSML